MPLTRSSTSVALTGTPTAPTAAAGTNTTQVATTAFVQTRAALKGALLTKSEDQTAANFTTATAITFNTENYDTDAFHEGVTNPSRLTIPAGVTKVRLAAQVGITSLTGDLSILLVIRKGGSSAYTGVAAMTTESGAVYAYPTCQTPVLTVTTGDYFEAFLLVETDTSVTIEADETWFSIEVIE